MRLREPATRKACPPHEWAITSSWWTENLVFLKRRCEVCKREESASMFHADFALVPPSFVHIADANWALM